MNTAETKQPRSIAVMGAGIVGAATALALAADGHAVTVIDRGDVGAGTSFGNAGGIVGGAVTPTATPGVIRSIPSYIFDRHGASVRRQADACRRAVIAYVDQAFIGERAIRVKTGFTDCSQILGLQARQVGCLRPGQRAVLVRYPQ